MLFNDFVFYMYIFSSFVVNVFVVRIGGYYGFFILGIYDEGLVYY